MEASKTTSHIRSLSLPSTSHPLDTSIQNHFCRVRASLAEPSSSSTICQNLSNIKDLHQQMDGFIHLPQNQQVLSYEHHRKVVEGVLEGSLVLLDATSTTLDALSQMKKSILDLKSALRRGGNKERLLEYVISRKMICKVLMKCLASLKKVEKDLALLTQPEKASVIVKMLKEAETITLSILKSLLSYLIGKKAASQSHGWSLVARVVKSKRLSSDAEHDTELVYIDQALSTLSENFSGAETKVVLTKLDSLENVIFEFEDLLEPISRCFVKVRVSLLNVLNQIVLDAI